MRFKIGDKVKVKNKSFFLNHPKADNEGGFSIPIPPGFINEMLEYCGKTFFISSVGTKTYTLKNIGWSWGDWMLEKTNLQLELFENHYE